MTAPADSAQELLATLVAFPTIAGRSNEALVNFAAERLQTAGARVTITPAASEDTTNLHAVLGPPDAPGLVLSAHTDVVAVEGQRWSRDPFRLHAEDGRLYGRGTTDMKGFIAAVLAAVATVDGRTMRRPVHVVLSSDEELGCVGIRPLLRHLADDVGHQPCLTVVGEPTRLRVVDRHKGKLALRVQVTGRACHSSHAPEGVNAVEYAARLVVAIGELGARLREQACDRRFSVAHATLSTGPIRGGVALNIVPDACTFDVELRHLPGQDPEAVRSEIVARAAALQREMRAIDPATGIAVTELVAYPGLAPDDDDGDDAVAAVAMLAGTAAGGAADFGTEAGLLQSTLGGPVLVCGPGDMAQAHRPDEYLEVDQLRGAVGLVARLLARLQHAQERGEP